ncbi:glycoside hydrolase family 97 protein [Sediminicola luteus]|uniref:Alpha-glucosidase n=1 Tax=Sediminicola luteus TaxID=319238 RepID=A0A2A4GDQ5_9FLAO|nr:glycoside hydrolase family 97 protein [Sediminicola luteus]PCE66583.1 hypothetical protein B7P33_04605 [Sediminicola luteus]
MRNTIALVFLACISFSCSDSVVDLKAPDGRLQIEIQPQADRFQYRILKDGQLLLDTAYIDLGQGTMEVVGKPITRSKDTVWEPVWGQASRIRDYYNEIGWPIRSSRFNGYLWIRAYDQGVAMRYEGSAGDTLLFKTTYAIDQAWELYAPNGEREPLGPLSLAEMQQEARAKSKGIKVPLVATNPKKGALAFLESDLYSATATQALAIRPTNGATFVGENRIVPQNDTLVTPWRLILVGDDLADLPTNTVALNVASPPENEDFAWVKPGLTLWDWRVHGYTTEDGHEYGIDNSSYERFIDFAAQHELPYFMIDANWFTKTHPGRFEVNPNLDLAKTLAYAQEKGVEIILYYDRHKGDYGDDKLFTYYADSLGVKGIKYGFMSTDVAFTKSAIRKTAEEGLLIDFHDGPLPITGVERTLPNAITREYCHAQQDSRRAFTPESFIKMALINAITGPLDMNNGNFDLGGINAGIRKKGPKKKNSYRSTVVSETARTLIIHSGLVCIPDAPEAYAAKADLFKFIKSMPVGQWDESHILEAEIGKQITTARRHGTDWYVGTVSAGKARQWELNLDFLEPGATYEAWLYEDTQATDTDPEAYRIRKVPVKKDDTLSIYLATDGGNAIRLIKN